MVRLTALLWWGIQISNPKVLGSYLLKILPVRREHFKILRKLKRQILWTPSMSRRLSPRNRDRLSSIRKPLASKSQCSIWVCMSRASLLELPKMISEAISTVSLELRSVESRSLIQVLFWLASMTGNPQNLLRKGLMVLLSTTKSWKHTFLSLRSLERFTGFKNMTRKLRSRRNKSKFSKALSHPLTRPWSLS